MSKCRTVVRETGPAATSLSPLKENNIVRVQPLVSGTHFGAPPLQITIKINCGAIVDRSPLMTKTDLNKIRYIKLCDVKITYKLTTGITPAGIKNGHIEKCKCR